MKKILAFVLLLIMVFSLVACGGKSDKENTVVGTWEYIDKNKSWTIGFTEDGDFYDSSGDLMRTLVDSSYYSSKYGSWNIRADGRLWFTTTMTIRTSRDFREHTDEYSWGYTYELDRDSLRIGDKTFTRIK